MTEFRVREVIINPRRKSCSLSTRLRLTSCTTVLTWFKLPHVINHPCQLVLHPVSGSPATFYFTLSVHRQDRSTDTMLLRVVKDLVTAYNMEDTFLLSMTDLSSANDVDYTTSLVPELHWCLVSADTAGKIATRHHQSLHGLSPVHLGGPTTSLIIIFVNIIIHRDNWYLQICVISFTCHLWAGVTRRENCRCHLWTSALFIDKSVSQVSWRNPL